MNRWLLLAVLILAPAAAFADDDARAIIDKAIKATGQDPKHVPKAITYKGKGIFYGMGGELPYTGTWALQYPNKSRMEIEGAFVIVLNGDKGWVSAMGNVMDLPKEQVTEQIESLFADYVAELTPLSDKAFTLKAAGTGKVEGKDTVAVKVSHKDRRDITLHFEKESGLLVKIDQKVKDESGKEVSQETIVKEYMKVGNVKVPGKILVNREGMKYVDGEMSDYKTHDKLPDETFAKP